MYYRDSKMEEALAEILDISLDTVDMLNLTIENDIGHDDFFYGYYVEFPQKTNIGEDILSNIKPSDVDKIPWGETKYYSESQFSNTSIDPFGYQAEWEYEKYLQAHTPSKENIINQLNKIKDIIFNECDETIKKSLILCSFSMVESYIKHLVWESVPDNLKENKSIVRKIENTRDRITLYKKHTNKTLKYIPYFQNVRHYLAHNIIKPTITNTQLELLDKDNNYCYYNIVQIIENLKDFIENPIE